MKVDGYPGHGSAWGYTAQSWIASCVNRSLHFGTYYCWFAKTFNAMRNGDDSNPLWVYMILDRAVAQGGVNNAKIRDIRANILLVLDRELRAADRTSEIPAAVAAVTQAPLDAFAPQLWRIDMAAVAGRCTSGHQVYTDEYLITDLRANEFEIIIQ